MVLVLVQPVFGQDTILKKSKTEVYSVLKDNPEIRQGEYSKREKKVILEKGLYDNGKKVGIWNFYDLKGNLEQAYNYSTNELVQNNNKEQFSNYQIIKDGKTTEVKPDLLPVFIGGRSRYDRFLNENLDYPKSAKSNGIDGQQFVLITLSKNGEVMTTEIYRNMTPDLDKEALRVIDKLPKEWIPGKYENRNVEVILAVPVLFNL